MIPIAAEVRLTPEDRAVPEARARAPTTAQRDAFRARIVLLADEGSSTRSIARALGTMPRKIGRKTYRNVIPNAATATQRKFTIDGGGIRDKIV